MALGHAVSQCDGGVEVAPMSVVRPFRSLSLLARTAIVLEMLLGLGAVAGGIALMVGPRGEIIPMSTSLLAGSPFSDYFVPGLILFAIVGLGTLTVAVLAWRDNPWAPLLTVGVGAALVIWLLVEFAVIGYTADPPVQPAYLALGLVILVLGVAWVIVAGSPFGERRAPQHR
jgi:hypothetical protein